MSMMSRARGTRQSYDLSLLSPTPSMTWNLTPAPHGAVTTIVCMVITPAPTRPVLDRNY
jgi:hypothetical protein